MQFSLYNTVKKKTESNVQEINSKDKIKEVVRDSTVLDPKPKKNVKDVNNIIS
jgi:hypothetical protein